MKTGMREKTCCFTGHRDIPQGERRAIQRRLYGVLRELIERGVRYFGSGGAMGFDLLAADTVLELRGMYPHIRLIMVLPCENQDRGWGREDMKHYREVVAHADKVVYLQKEYSSGCMHRRNRHLVDNSGICVAYCSRRTGGRLTQ